jgi:hypothetical protein
MYFILIAFAPLVCGVGNTTAFMQWLLDGGATFESMGRVPAYLNKNEGRGCAAARDIQRGDVVARIPMGLLLTPRRARAISPLARFYAERTNEGALLSSQLLTLALLDERVASMCGAGLRCTRRSHFGPYWKMLPTLADYKRTLPLMFERDELGWIQGSPVREKVLAVQRSWESEWARIAGMLPEFCDFAELFDIDLPRPSGRRPNGVCRELNEGRLAGLKDAFLWARAVTTTRAFSITVNAEDPDEPSAAFGAALLRETNLVGHCAEHNSTEAACPYAGRVESAALCEARCRARAGCSGWTWHGAAQPPTHRAWALQCYLVVGVAARASVAIESAPAHTSGFVDGSGSGDASATGAANGGTSAAPSSAPPPLLSTIALVPLADVCNHRMRASVNIGWTFSREHGAFELTATRAVAKGEKLFNSYGENTNGHYYKVRVLLPLSLSVTLPSILFFDIYYSFSVSSRPKSAAIPVRRSPMLPPSMSSPPPPPPQELRLR